MKHFSFVCIDCLSCEQLNELEERFECQETVTLASEAELIILLKLLGSKLGLEAIPLIKDVVKSYIVEVPLIPIPDSKFDEFYSGWLDKTKRDSNMDEYGQLLHLNSFVQTNKDKLKWVVLSEAIS